MDNLKNIDDLIISIQDLMSEEEIVVKLDALLMDTEIIYLEDIDNPEIFIYKGLDFETFFVKGDGEDNLYPPEGCFYK